MALQRNTTGDHMSECAALGCIFGENMLGFIQRFATVAYQSASFQCAASF